MRHDSRRHPRRSGFTLVELLTVIGIIALVVALAVPLFGLLTGRRSVQSGQNVVAAALAQARTVAVSRGVDTALIAYHDPTLDRVRLIIATVGRDPTDEGDPLEKYKGWCPTGSGDGEIGSAYVSGANGSPVTQSDRVIFLARDKDNRERPAVRLFKRLNENGNQAPRDFGTPDVLDAADYWGTEFNNWGLIGAASVGLAAGTEAHSLPPGVGLQLVNAEFDTNTTPTNPDDDVARYSQIGAVVFDPQGRLKFDRITLPVDSDTGVAIGLGDDLTLTPAVGVAIYDRSAFNRNDGFGSGYADVPGGVVLNARYAAAGMETTPTRPDADVERWLDDNAEPLLVNRYSGSLTLSQ